jgi:Transcriptional regulators
MPSRVTIRDIAAKAGVHFTTVGLALRNSPRLSAETRAKVRAVAEKLGYRPDPMLSALNAYRQTKRRPQFQATIAWINNWPDREEPYHNTDVFEYHQGALKRAKELGYALEEFWLREKGMSLSKLRRILKARNIQGVIIPPQPAPNTEFDFDFAGLSAVALGYTLKSPSLHVVTNHQFRTMLLMITRLKELGFRRIGLVIGRDWNERVGLNWLGGLLASRETSAVPLEFVHLSPRNSDLAAHVRESRVEIVVSHRQVYEDMRKFGLRIPEEVSFANLSVEYHSRHISGTYQNSSMVGQKAVDLLVTMLHHGETGIPLMANHLLVDSVWNPGTTIRSPIRVA